jgi:hypothetical protein
VGGAAEDSVRDGGSEDGCGGSGDGDGDGGWVSSGGEDGAREEGVGIGAETGSEETRRADVLSVLFDMFATAQVLGPLKEEN